MTHGTDREDRMERLCDLDEESLLARIVPRYAAASRGSAPVQVGAGDDAAVLATPSGSVVATTDSMVRERDWRDDWSSAQDVGRKVAASNLADVAAMGAVPTGLLIALAADPQTPVDWCLGMADGLAAAAGEAGAAVLGGDLSSAPPGVVIVSVTALGDLEGRAPVLRSGARPGDVVAVCGSLGRSGAGLALLQRHGPDALPAAGADLVATHRAPRAALAAGPIAARAGARALIDISDGLVRDLGRVATASGVAVDLDAASLRSAFADGVLSDLLGPDIALEQVLSGGEEHSLVACFPATVVLEGLPGEPWTVIGRVLDVGPGGPEVTLDGATPSVRGWDHFAGA